MVADRDSFDVVVAWSLDRIGRFDSMEGGYWLFPLRQAGCNMETVTDGVIDWNSNYGRMSLLSMRSCSDL